MLVRLLYASRLVDHAYPGKIMEIVEEAQANNPLHGITGILCHSEQMFMQVIEGGRERINALYAAILKDPRHSNVVLLHYEEIHERKYAAWTMGNANLSKINPSLLLRYSALPVFDPHIMTGDNALALIDDLTAQAAIHSRP